MEYLASPGVPGTLVMCVIVAAWLLGHRQGRLAPLAGPLTPLPFADERLLPEQGETQRSASPSVDPCRHAAQAERMIALEGATSLGALHDEITAYRLAHRKQLALEVHDQLAWSKSGGGDCRYLGLTGHRTCPAPRAALVDCACGSSLRGSPVVAQRERPQPPSEPAVFARV